MPIIVGTITVWVTEYCSHSSSTRGRVEQRQEHRRAALRGNAEHPAHRRGVEHRRLVQEDVVGVEPPHLHHVVEVQHLGAVVEQHALRQTRRAAGVHEHGGVVLVGLVGNRGRRVREEILVA